MKTKLMLRSLLAAGAALALLVGCASGPTVRSHADAAVRYDHYKSFALIRPNHVTAARSPDITPMLIRQSREDAEAAFVAQGLVQAPQESADLLVLVHGGLEDKLNVTDWGYSYGRFGRAFAGRGGQYELSQYKEGTLLIDVFDAKTRELIWRGVAVSDVGEAPKPETLKAAIAAVVARYPN